MYALRVGSGGLTSLYVGSMYRQILVCGSCQRCVSEDSLGFFDLSFSRRW